MLSPRRVLVNQQKSQAMQSIAKQAEGYFQEIDGIYYSSYQRLEQSLLNGFNTLGSFDIVICDEAHYFLCDAVFNPYTQISLEAILKHRKSIILFLSGTIEDFERYIFSKSAPFGGFPRPALSAGRGCPLSTLHTSPLQRLDTSFPRGHQSCRGRRFPSLCFSLVIYSP